MSTENGESGRVPKMWDPGEYREGRNPGEYRKWGIQESTGKVEIRASTENRESGRVPEKGPDEYREKDRRRGRIRASTGEPPD